MRFGNDDQPTSLDYINNEDFICEIENNSVLWDTSHEDYHNNTERKNAWDSIVRKFIPEFDDKSLSEKNELCYTVQKRWKNIRTCYVREVKTRKEDMKGGVKKKKSTYIYYDLLRFLDTVTKTREQPVNVEEECWIEFDDLKFDPLMNENMPPCPPEFVSTTILSDSQSAVKQEHTADTPAIRISSTNSIADKQTDSVIDQYSTSKRKRKDKENEEDELLQLLKKKIIDHENRAEAEDTDEDRMFLLSLVSELRKVPSDVKLRVKSDIIMAIVNGQNYLKYGLLNHPLVDKPQNNSCSLAQNSTLGILNEQRGPSCSSRQNDNTFYSAKKSTAKLKHKLSTSSQVASDHEEALCDSVPIVSKHNERLD